MRKLNDARRAALAGFRRARAKAKAELARQAADFDAELMVLRDEFCDEVKLEAQRASRDVIELD